MNESEGSPQSRVSRGARSNPSNRFESLHLEPIEWDEQEPEDAFGRKPTRFYKDVSGAVLSRNDSPDLGFNVAINPYRGCEHGCIYCYARPTHEYLGFSSGLDFETQILVKTNAPEALEKAFRSRSWKPEVVAMSGVTDPYQPIERKTQLTRRVLEVFARFRNPISIITKNALALRDLDILRDMAVWNGVAVAMSVTTLDPDLRRWMEPRTSPISARFEAIERLAEAGVQVGVLTAPLIPGLNDHEAPELLRRAKDAGASFANYTLLRLPYNLKELFDEWLREHYPDRYEKVMGRIRSVRGGQLNDSDFNSRLSGTGIYAEQIKALCKVTQKKVGLAPRIQPLNCEAFRRLEPGQLELF